DLTAAIALGQSFLGSVAVWLGGDDAQRARMAELLLSGQLAALALTEEAHGSDVLASEVTARATAHGYALTGTKWLINNATRSAALTVFARTSSEGGLHGSTLFLVDKGALAPGAFTTLPKFRTHGIRGADISGVRFDDAQLSLAARLGEEGSGAERVLTALQLTRAGCSTFSLGAADTALRLALDFARERSLYGATVFDIAHARSMLVDAFAELLLAECVSIAALRGAQGAASQLSLWSQIAKLLVPTVCERVIHDTAVVLGARHYVREGFAGGAFQKLLRDAAVVSLFDGSTAVNLDGIGAQLVRLSAERAAPAEERQRTLARVFDLAAPLPAIFSERLELMTAGRDDVTQGLSSSLERLAGLRVRTEEDGAAPIDPELLEEVLALGQDLTQQLAVLGEQVSVLARDRSMLKRSPELFELARRYSRLFAGAACVHLFAHSRARLDPWGARGSWLAFVLARVLQDFSAPSLPRRSPHFDDLTRRLTELHDEERAFALVAIPLGRSE
ncbi:MAG: acyl-CoA dehydrogenase, partial [Deltaproteobacteria bacterium]|nr:acyl-CoA dehydrogenase [Deltaproteobacteria bacterium]